jgi:diacylglycerol kinase (ATP)
MDKRILFIVNPASGSKRDIEPELLRFSKKYKFMWEVYYTEKTGPADKIRDKISSYKPDIVVAAGGDGTINHVASSIINSKVELGVIPAGSANGLAYNLGIPADFGEAMDFMLKSDARPLDVIQLNDDIYCFHLGDIGFNAEIVKRFEKEGSRGLLGYGRQMIKELFSKRKIFYFRLRTADLNKSFRSELLVIANARFFGTGAVINPAGILDDGKFEIIIIKPVPWWILFHLARMFIFGKIDNRKYIKVISAREAEIHFVVPQDMQVDGEITRGVEKLKIKMIPSAVRVRY